VSAPRVTIITPTYNRAGYLPETVESIAAQRYADLEHIVVDDGSTDDTPAVLAALARKHPHLRTIRQENTGEAGATNHGWRLATGDYVAMVSSDDPQPPALVQTSVAALEAHPDVVVSYPDWIRIDAQSEPVATVRVAEPSIVHMLVNFECSVGPGAFIRKRLVPWKNLRQSYRYCSDFSSWLPMMLLGPFLRIAEPVAAWRDHPAGATVAGRGARMAAEYVDLIFRFFERADLPQQVRDVEFPAKRRVLWVAFDLCRRTAPAAAARYAARMIAYQSPMETAAQARRVLARLR
jgi:glycosyltransferase involved in cell wall biosynthesis